MNELDELITQGDIELRKATRFFMEVEGKLDRAIAIQWLMNQSKGSDSAPQMPLIKTINDMIEVLKTYTVDMEADYNEFLETVFLEQARLEFSAEAIDNAIDGK